MRATHKHLIEARCNCSSQRGAKPVDPVWHKHVVKPEHKVILTVAAESVQDDGGT